ncbi:DNA methyltransferase [Thalassoroseus pseudoceratinae]|uniref:DNA methyltransferase n=1 Tax=Thalassoroseus pseudoceratinae TaxID=2713176 RepID=UPI00141F52B7|nr:DNA methyltransferase [Thalassoroseus pseudoceratinae]
MNSTTNISISDIQIGDRFRKDLGDIDGLAQSITEDGLLQPIGVTPDNRLVFGYRRLLAFRDVLKRDEIPAVVIDIDNLARGEYVENTFRKDLTASEMVAITDALRSFTRGGDRCSEQYRNNVVAVTKKRACEIVGWKLDKYDDAKKVVQLAIPELVQLMDEEKVSLHAAARLADEPEDIQKEAVKRVEAATTAAERRGILRTVNRIKRARQRAEQRRAECEAPDTSESIRLYHCSFQKLTEVAGLKPASVHCVLTDIPFGNEFLSQINDLAQFVGEVLAEGGVFVCYVGQHKLNEKIRAFDQHLNYQWMGTSRWVGRCNQMHSLNVVSNSIPFVVYTKGERAPSKWSKWIDTLECDSREKEFHEWQRPLAEMETLLRSFTMPGDLVVDPCGGGFTTAAACQNLGRKCISCDSDKANVVVGRQRLRSEAKEEVVEVEGEKIGPASVAHLSHEMV